MKIKQVIFGLTILLGLNLWVTNPIAAITANTTTKQVNRADAVKAMPVQATPLMQQAQERVETRQEVMTEDRQQIRAQVTARHAERLERRFGLYYEKLKNFAQRIETRAQIMADDGDDTSDALVKVAEAKNKLEEAKKQADASVASFNSIEADEFEMQNDSALAARNQAQEGRQLFKEVHSLLVQAINLLKN